MISFSLPHRPTHPPPGCIRFFKKPAFVATGSYNWLDVLLDSTDRTLAQWRALIQDFEKPLFSEFIPGPVFHFTFETPTYVFPNLPDPLFHRAIVAETLQSLLQENLRIRWILRRCLQRRRARKCAQRVIGATDVVTLTKIPDDWKVAVCDIGSRYTYLFHVMSLQKMFVNALLNQSYAIASPIIPKNPYTNIPWTLGQMIHIVSEIQIRLFANRHVYADPWLIRFRAARYSIPAFLRQNNRGLQSHAAKAFFTEPDNLFFGDLYRETLQDLFQDLGYPIGGQSYKIILDRCLKPELMAEWDIIVSHSFVHTNHHFFPSNSTIRSYIQFEEYIGSVYRKTIQFVNAIKTPLFLRSGERVFLSTV